MLENNSLMDEMISMRNLFSNFSNEIWQKLKKQDCLILKGNEENKNNSLFS